MLAYHPKFKDLFLNYIYVLQSDWYLITEMNIDL